MNYHLRFNALAFTFLVSIGGCAVQATKVDSNNAYTAPIDKETVININRNFNDKVDSYFLDQYIILKRLFPEFIISNENEREIKLIVPSYEGYKTGTSTLDVRLKNRIREMASVLSDYKETAIIVYGYTDNIGKVKANINLSKLRADEVRELLIVNGVNSFRIQSFAGGDGNPICSNDTAEGRYCNRRVEILIKDAAIEK